MNTELNVNAELVAHTERMAKMREEQACIDAAAERIWKAWTESQAEGPVEANVEQPKIEPMKPIKYEGGFPLNRFYINAVNGWYEDEVPEDYEEANSEWKFTLNELRQMNFKFDHALFYCEDGFNTAKGAVECEYMDVHDASPTYIRIFDDLIDVDGSGVEVECEVAHLMQRILVCGGYYDAEGEYDNDDDRYNDVANCLQVHLYVVKRPDGSIFAISREDYDRIVSSARMNVAHVRHPQYADNFILYEDGSTSALKGGGEGLIGDYYTEDYCSKTVDQHVNDLISELGAWRVKRMGTKVVRLTESTMLYLDYKITEVSDTLVLVLE